MQQVMQTMATTDAPCVNQVDVQPVHTHLAVSVSSHKLCWQHSSTEKEWKAEVGMSYKNQNLVRGGGVGGDRYFQRWNQQGLLTVQCYPLAHFFLSVCVWVCACIHACISVCMYVCVDSIGFTKLTIMDFSLSAIPYYRFQSKWKTNKENPHLSLILNATAQTGKKKKGRKETN